MIIVMELLRTVRIVIWMLFAILQEIHETYYNIESTMNWLTIFI